MDSELLAEILSIPEGNDSWECFAFSEYIGAVPDLFDIPTALILTLEESTKEGDFVTVSGTLEYVHHKVLVRYKKSEVGLILPIGPFNSPPSPRMMCDTSMAITPKIGEPCF